MSPRTTFHQRGTTNFKSRHVERKRDELVAISSLSRAGQILLHTLRSPQSGCNRIASLRCRDGAVRRRFRRPMSRVAKRVRLCQVLRRLSGSVARVWLQPILFHLYRELGRTFDHVMDYCLAIKLGQLENAVLSQFSFENCGHDRYDAHPPSSTAGAPCRDTRCVARSSLSLAWRKGSGVRATS